MSDFMRRGIEVLLWPARAESPRALRIDDTLEAMQALVGGGLIEVVPAGRVLPVIARAAAGIDLVCNEEGRLRGMPPNRWGLVGPFFAMRTGPDGEARSLTERDKILLLHCRIDTQSWEDEG